MKSAFRKSTLRSVKQSLPRFVSIILIIFLGAGILAGLVATSPNMQKAGDAYYDKTNTMDFKLISTSGFQEDDISAIKKVKDVQGVMPGYTTDNIGTIEDKNYIFRFNSLFKNNKKQDKDYINQLQLTKGSWPKESNEIIIITPKNGNDSRLQLGDTIHINNTNGNLSQQDYKVSAFAETPLYLSFMHLTTNLGSGHIDFIAYLPQSNFTSLAYTNVYITMNQTKKWNTFQDTYIQSIKKTTTLLEDVATKQSTLFYNTIVHQIDEQLKQVSSPQKESMRDAELSKISKPTWYVLDRSFDGAFASFQEDTLRMKNLASVFPIIFYLVAALVSLTTMTRMVDEDRILIGTFKALGYSTKRIAFRYLGYAASASTIGGILGVLVGFQLLPSIIWDAYGILYKMPSLVPSFYWQIAFISIVVSVLCTTLVTAFVLRKALKEVPSSLMLPKTPPRGKRIFLEYIKPIWSSLSFSSKVTIRNMFLNKSRMLMTIIGIIGCTSLLLTGFGIQNSINNLVDGQFKDIQTYNLSIGFKHISEELQNDMSDVSKFKASALIEKNAITISKNKDTENVTLMVPEQSKSLKSMINFKERVSQKPIVFNENSVVITEKIAILFDLKIGDTLHLKYIGKTDKHPVVVTGITENYAFNYVYLGKEAYQKAFLQVPEFNTYIAKTQKSANETQIKEKLNQIEAVQTVQFARDVTAAIYDSMDSINIIIIVLIVASGLLAFIVLYNLTNINIGERQREIATVKVLGFYDNETYTYILRESFGLALIGCAIGLFAGTYLYLKVIETVEMNYIMFSRTIHLQGYITAVILTILFALFVSFIMTFKIKKIDMLESLKSVE